MEKPEKRLSKASRNYMYNLFAFFPFVFLLFTGVIVLRYHGGAPYVLETFGIDGYQWLWIHRITAIANVPIIAVHLFFNIHWFKMLFSLRFKGKNSGMNFTLFVIFLLCLITAFLAWLVYSEKPLAEVLQEVHSKLGLLLIFFFMLHLGTFFRWFINMTKKHFLGKRSE